MLTNVADDTKLTSEESRVAKAKKGKHTATSLVRLSAKTLAQVRKVARERGMSMRALGDAALRQYLGLGA